MAGPEPPDFDENPTAWPMRTGLWAFGVAIVSGALVSVLLIATQAFVVDTWITFCPVPAAVSFAIFSTDKPLAGLLLHSRRVRGSGGLAWCAIWSLEAGKGKVARA